MNDETPDYSSLWRDALAIATRGTDNRQFDDWLFADRNRTVVDQTITYGSDRNQSGVTIFKPY